MCDEISVDPNRIKYHCHTNNEFIANKNRWNCIDEDYIDNYYRCTHHLITKHIQKFDSLKSQS